MNVLYVLTNPARPEECQLPASVRLGAVFTDTEGQEQTGLRACLDSLKHGDTLYLAKERHLSRNFGNAIELLGGLARRGIHVWLGRTGQLIESSTSPFLTLSPASADAIVNFCKAFTLRRSMQGFQKARKQGRTVGREKKPMPENFDEIRSAWKAGKISYKEAAAICGVSVGTFYKRVQA